MCITYQTGNPKGGRVNFLWSAVLTSSNSINVQDRGCHSCATQTSNTPHGPHAKVAYSKSQFELGTNSFLAKLVGLHTKWFQY
mmetsp:Transcript_109672/g.186515  ORF Transcript_109672/g.186515 Transcript_109672/m.186515 type:complete len:83 (-) Transcript_109672:1227-1475(-)